MHHNWIPDGSYDDGFQLAEGTHHYEHHASLQETGEHPVVSVNDGESGKTGPLCAGSEQISSTQHTHEPEDTLPDRLDKNK